MAARKLQQEVDKCFKKVSEGVAEFESIYEKIEQSTNAAQKEKLEDNLKREIKKLQRLRDQIKTWAASNDIKDKTPLLENRKLIETQMEKFKAVEKAMKTKAYSKEGLSAAAKLDPKERAKLEACEFLGNMVDELERQIETLEAEGEAIGATLKKGKNHSTKADRIAEIERITERHKWHQGKLELIKRSLENGGVETDQVTDLEESIRYYVSDGANEDYEGEGDEMYDDLNLEEEEDAYGMNNENDRLSSQDNQSVQEESADTDTRSGSIPGAKSKTAVSEPPVTFGRRPSTQLKSPLPALATLHNPSSVSSNGNSTNNMKPASIPTRAPGEPLKYASAAAAATNNVGIAPLPPPPGATPPSGTSISTAPLPVVAPSRPTTSSPVTSSAQPVITPQSKSNLPVTASLAEIQTSSTQNPSPALSQSSTVPNLTISASRQPTPSTEKSDPVRLEASRDVSGKAASQLDPTDVSKAEQRPNRTTNGTHEANPEDGDESVYHLPSGLQDLIQSFEVTQSRPFNLPSQSSQRMMDASWDGRITSADMEQPRNYKPKYRFNTPAHYPQEPLPIFDNPQLYSRIDPDTLFYVFYYKQGSYQQYLAAKSLKDQSWRFHKQYQTWFQRHEEPKTITDEFEQGTYRFFDYESTWMNRRKADFKFVYKFLEDDV